MTKVIGMLVALAMLCAMPAVALAGGSDNVSAGDTQAGDIDQSASGGDSVSVGGAGGSGGAEGSGASGGDAESGDGGDAGNQACLIQQNAGDDANAECDQSQSFGDDVEGDGDGDGDGADEESDDDESDDDVGDDIGGGSVESVTLARTGFDAWVLGLIGGVLVAGGLALLAAQRRGRRSA